MSLFIAGAIAGTGLLAGLLVAVSEQLRAKLRRRRQAEQMHATQPALPKATRPVSGASDSASATAESRAAAYQEILDALGDELDDDIAEWEAVLDDFPQVIGAEELRQPEDRASELALEASREKAPKVSKPQVRFTVPHRTRRVSDDERDMILRLMRTGFACEEIALWLNLPLERVQELMPRN